MVQRFDIANVGCAERIWRQAEELHRRGHAVTLVNYPHPERRARLPILRPDAPRGVEVLNLDRRAVAMPGNFGKLRERLRDSDLVHLWKPYPDTALP
ncbi:MAG: glycosyltransferase, partial [Candidatus Omnitrophica bacterium]|nr:glycosyltransferase [Candidatus Omnitrophota bacterium]